MALNLPDLYPAFLRKYDLPANYQGSLPEIGKKSIEAKAELREALGLPDEGRIEIPLNSIPDYQKVYPNTLDWYCRTAEKAELPEVVAAFRNNELLLKNAMPDGTKLTRYFLKKLRKIKDFVVPAKAEAKLKRTYTVDYLERSLQSFFSEIKADDKRLFITTNMWDQLNCSTASGTNSCFAPSGCHSTAPVSMALSKRVAMLYSTKTNVRNAASRAWVVFSDDFSEYFILRTYGSWSDAMTSSAEAWLNSTLASNFGWENKWEARENNTVFLGKGFHWTYELIGEVNNVYIDEHPTLYRYNPSGGGSELGFLPKYEKPVCLHCGTEHGVHDLICNSCLEKRTSCSSCRKHSFSSLKSKDGKHLCDSCAAKYYACPICGLLHKEQKGVALCTHTISKECAVCGQAIRVSAKDGGELCQTCSRAAVASTCEGCGKPHYDLLPYEDKVLCPLCIHKELSLSPVERYMQKHGIRMTPETQALLGKPSPTLKKASPKKLLGPGIGEMLERVRMGAPVHGTIPIEVPYA